MQRVIYSQTEADEMLAMPKVARYEGQIYEVTAHVREGFTSAEFDAYAPGAEPPVRYKIITQANLDIRAYCITLEGSMGGRSMKALCRYDVHNTLHTSKCRCCGPPPQIWPGQFHLHRYNECCVRRGTGWDRCATLLDLPEEPDLTRQLRDLIGIFIEEMQLTFSDSGTHDALFRTGQP